MSVRVVDASVVAAAFFREDHAEAARRLLVSGEEVHAPDLIYAEFANVVWKRHMRREIAREEAGLLLADMLRLPLCVTPSGELAEDALQIALRSSRTVYDSLYLALALRMKTVMVTADRRLANSLAGGPLEKYVAWIGESGRAFRRL